MNTKNKNKLQNYSWLFMQLGLVLALLVSYLVLELKSKVNLNYGDVIKTTQQVEEPYTLDTYVIKKKILKKKLPQKREQPQSVTPVSPVVTTIVDVKPVSNTTTKVEQIINIKPTIPTITVTSVTKPVKKEDSPKTLSGVQQVPSFPGCKGSNDQMLACFKDNIRKFINKKFDASVVESSDLYSNQQKIYISFKIDKNGDVVILNSRAKHKDLKKEALRVVNRLPKMTPGKQNGKSVEVIYNLPITINIR